MPRSLARPAQSVAARQRRERGLKSSQASRSQARLLLELFAERSSALTTQRVVHRSLVRRHVPNLSRRLKAVRGKRVSCVERAAPATQQGTHVATSASPASSGVCCGAAAAPSGEGCSGVACERMTEAFEGSTTKDSSIALKAPIP